MGRRTKKSKVIRIHLKVSVCTKELFGLFDFMSKGDRRIEKHFILEGDSQIITEQDKNTVFFTNAALNKEFDQYFNSIHVINEQRRINFIPKLKSAKICNRIWECLKMEKRQIYEGDIIRLGKQVIFLKKISFNPLETSANNFLELNQYLDGKKENAFGCAEFEENDIECRICFEKQDKDDPFVDLCQCSKSMPVHFSCIQKWVWNKCQVQKSKSVTWVYLNKFQCDICCDDYPYQVKYKGEYIRLFNATVDKTKKHCIFEVFEIESNTVCAILILYFSSTIAKYKVGRAAKNSIVFDDMSLSRHHSEIQFNRDRIYVQDLGSRFGSHIEIPSLLLPNKRKEISIQIGKFYFNFHFFKGAICNCKPDEKTKIEVNPLSKLEVLKKEFTAKRSLKMSVVEKENEMKKQKSKKKGIFSLDRLKRFMAELTELKKVSFKERDKHMERISRTVHLNEMVQAKAQNRPISAFESVKRTDYKADSFKIKFLDFEKKKLPEEQVVNDQDNSDDDNIIDETFRDLQSQENDEIYEKSKKYFEAKNKQKKSSKFQMESISNIYKTYVSNLVINKQIIGIGKEKMNNPVRVEYMGRTPEKQEGFKRDKGSEVEINDINYQLK